MNCRRCGQPLEGHYVCPQCGQEDKVMKKIVYTSNHHYNDGLEKARVRDLSGAVKSLNQALYFNKRNTDARNLLGLIYYQMGEVVAALSEWVISAHFSDVKGKKNPAVAYIKNIQKDPTGLKEANRVIRKYNLALQYVREKKADLAIIELKKVVNISPTYIRAYQLLGLLYMQRKQYVAARKVLMRAVKVDRNNVTTLNYLQELNRLNGKPERSELYGNDQMTINDPNPVVIEENTGRAYSDYNTSFLSFINVLIGIVIGAAVIWLLVVPSVTKVKTAEYNQAVVEYSAQISERNKQITSLESDVSALKDKLALYQSSGGTSVAETSDSQTYINQAMAYYMAEDFYNAGYALAEVDPETVVDPDQQKVYNLLKNAVYFYVTDNLYANALESYDNADYLDAIEGFTKVLRLDPDYTYAIYYMGRCYHMLGDVVNATTYYQRLLDRYPDSSLVEDTEKYMYQIQNATGLDLNLVQDDSDEDSDEDSDDDSSDDWSDEDDD